MSCTANIKNKNHTTITSRTVTSLFEIILRFTYFNMQTKHSSNQITVVFSEFHLSARKLHSSTSACRQLKYVDVILRFKKNKIISSRLCPYCTRRQRARVHNRTKILPDVVLSTAVSGPSVLILSRQSKHMCGALAAIGLCVNEYT